MEMGRKPKCCRRLFADNDGEHTAGEDNTEIEAFLAEEKRKTREKWNFDFEKGVPLEGRYEWVRVAPPSPPPAKAVLSGAESRSRPPRAETEVVAPAGPQEVAEEVGADEDGVCAEEGQGSNMEVLGDGEERSSSETENAQL